MADAEFKELTVLEGTDQITFLNKVNEWFDTNTNTNTIKKKKSFFNFSNNGVLTRDLFFQYAQVANDFKNMLYDEHMKEFTKLHDKHMKEFTKLHNKRMKEYNIKKQLAAIESVTNLYNRTNKRSIIVQPSAKSAKSASAKSTSARSVSARSVSAKSASAKSAKLASVSRSASARSASARANVEELSDLWIIFYAFLPKILTYHLLKSQFPVLCDTNAKCPKKDDIGKPPLCFPNLEQIKTMFMSIGNGELSVTVQNLMDRNEQYISLSESNQDVDFVKMNVWAEASAVGLQISAGIINIQSSRFMLSKNNVIGFNNDKRYIKGNFENYYDLTTGKNISQKAYELDPAKEIPFKCSQETYGGKMRTLTARRRLPLQGRRTRSKTRRPTRSRRRRRGRFAATYGGGPRGVANS